MRREVGRRVKSSPILEPPVALFDEAQTQVETLINNTTYPNFLKSDMYLHYIQVCENGIPSRSRLLSRNFLILLQSVQNRSSSSADLSCESSSSSSSVSVKELSSFPSGVGPLPIIHEDVELNAHPLAHTPGKSSQKLNVFWEDYTKSL